MEWGPEIVYALLGFVVSALLTWLVRGFQVKKPLMIEIANLKAELAEQRLEAREERLRAREEQLLAREETQALREQLLRSSEADITLKEKRASFLHEEALDARLERRRKERMHRYRKQEGQGEMMS